jgi:hypothetical protein
MYDFGYYKKGIKILPGQIWTVGKATIDGGGQVRIIKITGGDGLITVKNVINNDLIFIKIQNLGKLINNKEDN